MKFLQTKKSLLTIIEGFINYYEGFYNNIISRIFIVKIQGYIIQEVNERKFFCCSFNYFTL